MEEITFTIPNISCGHCTHAIESELAEMDGVAGVTGNVKDKTVTVRWDAPLTQSALIDRLREIGYPAQEA